MKKKLSFILALALTLTLFSGCKKTNENTEGLPSETASSPTQMTTTEAVTTEETTVSETTAEETTTEVTTTEETTVETTAETTETASETTAATTAATTSETTVAATTAAKPEWNETKINEVMYTNQACYSRKKAIVGADTAAQYKKGTKVSVVAATDTGYYKLSDGTFIHSDYLTEEKPATTTAATTAAAETQKTTAASSSAYTGDKLIKSSYNIDYTTRYAYKTLSSTEKTFYANLVYSVSNLMPFCEVPSGMSSDEIYRVYGVVYCQEPQLFWMQSGVVISSGGTIRLKYLMTDIKEIQAAQDKIDANASTIISKVNSVSGTVSKIKVIYDSIVLNNDFELTGDGFGSSIYNGLRFKDGIQCIGYTKSFMYLCDLAGIECMAITGKNPAGDTHAWNKVYCENGYYNIDATWGDPHNSHDSKYIRYSFFLVPDEWIVDSHLNPSTSERANGTVVTYFTPPAATKSSCNYFKIYNKEFTSQSTAETAMYKEFDDAIAAGKNVAHIRVTDKAIYDKLMSDEYAKAFQKYCKAKGASSLARQKLNVAGTLVVQYDIFY